MSKKESPLEKIGNKNPFKTPEGYFEHLSDRVLSQLPERTALPPQPVGTWQRVQPWLYLAAMFCGIALMINLLHSPKKSSEQGLNLSSSTEIEDFYQYYETQLASRLYDEVFYTDIETNTNF